MPKYIPKARFINSYTVLYGNQTLYIPNTFRRSPNHSIDPTPGGRWKVRALVNGDWKAYIENPKSSPSASYQQVFSTFELAVRYAHAQSKVCHLLKDDVKARRTSQYFVRANFIELEQTINEERNQAEKLRIDRLFSIDYA